MERLFLLCLLVQLSRQSDAIDKLGPGLLTLKAFSIKLVYDWLMLKKQPITAKLSAESL